MVCDTSILVQNGLLRDISMTTNFWILLLLSIVFVVSLVVIVNGRKVIPDIHSESDVLNILKKGDQLHAIKAYRQLHGVGFKDAKEAVSKMLEKSN